MAKDINNKELLVGQIVEDLFWDEVGEVIEVLENNKIKIKYFGVENFKDGEILEVDGQGINIITKRKK